MRLISNGRHMAEQSAHNRRLPCIYKSLAKHVTIYLGFQKTRKRGRTAVIIRILTRNPHRFVPGDMMNQLAQLAKDASHGCLGIEGSSLTQVGNFLEIPLIFQVLKVGKGFPSGAVVKNLPANAGDSRDVGSIPGSGRSL